MSMKSWLRMFVYLCLILAVHDMSCLYYFFLIIRLFSNSLPFIFG